MFPLPFYPRPPLGVTRPPGFQEGVFKGRAGNKEEVRGELEISPKPIY